MSGDSRTLTSIAKKLSEQTQALDAYWESIDNRQPSFSQDAPEPPDTAKYVSLHGELSSTLADLQRLVDGPKRNLRRTVMLGNDLAAFQIAFDFDFFQLVPLDRTIKLKDLAARAGIDADRAARMIRMLTTHRIFQETEPGYFAHTAASAAFHRDEELRCAAHYMLDECFQAASMSSACVKASPNESDSTHSPFCSRHGVPMFTFYAQHPDYAARFAKAMAGGAKLSQQVRSVRDDFPWGRLRGSVLDVGGGNGYVSVDLAKTFPDLNFIVQDGSDAMLSQGRSQLPPALNGRVAFMQHSFFDPQPKINDVAAYLIRQCTHNWSDRDVITIFRSLVPGLECAGPGTPLLINDIVMPVPGSLPIAEENTLRQMDVLMFVVLGAKQRSVAEFEALLQSADERYEIKHVHSEGAMGLIEVQLRSG